MKIFSQLIFLTLANVSQLAYALTPDDKFYAGAELGIPISSNQESLAAQGLISSLGGSASASESGMVLSGRIFGGYKMLENMDIEIGGFQSTESSLQFNGTSARLGGSYSGNAHANAYGVNVATLLRPTIASGWHPVFFRLGGHWARLESTSTITGIRSTTTISSGSGMLYGFGYDGTINKNTDWRVQVTRSQRLAGNAGNNTSIVSFGIMKKF
jgi:hypothetical protein